MKESFYSKNDISINYPEFISDFFKGTYNITSCPQDGLELVFS